MKQLIQLLFPIGYPLLVLVHAIYGALVAGLLIIVNDWEITMRLGLMGALWGILVGAVLYVFLILLRKR